jgi:hypothetical protein
MAPLVVFAADVYDNEINEFDECTLCGHVTKLLVMVRADQVLISICGKCCEGLQEGYAAMLSKRLRSERLQPDADSR